MQPPPAPNRRIQLKWPMALLLFLAINHPSLAFVTPHQKSTAALKSNKLAFSSSERTSHSYAQTFVQRRAVILSSSEVDDDSFFDRASQQASQFRMQQLKEGQAPLAISLSSLAENDSEGVEKEGGDQVGTSTTDKGDAEDGKELKEQPQQPSSQDIKIPIDGILSLDEDTQVEKKSLGVDESVVPLTGELSGEGMTAEEAEGVRLARLSGARGDAQDDAATAQPLITEGQTAEEAEESRNARLDAADEAAKILKQPATAMAEEEEGGADADVATPEGKEGDDDDDLQQQLQSLKEVKFPVDPPKERQRAQQEEEKEIATEAKPETEKSVEIESDGSSSDGTATNKKPLDEKEDTANTTVEQSSESQPASTSNTPKLSSDGKVLFEPSPASSSSEVNQENVDLGLFVLTRSLLTLKSIVDKQDDK